MDVNDAGFKAFKNSVLQMFGWETPNLNRVVFIYEKTPQDTFKTTYIYIFLTSDLMRLCEWRLSSLGGRGGGSETLLMPPQKSLSRGVREDLHIAWPRQWRPQLMSRLLETRLVSFKYDADLSLTLTK